MTAPIWAPRLEQRESSHLARFGRWVGDRRELALPDYDALWAWSVGRPGEFWADVAEYFAVPLRGDVQRVLGDASMPGASWFPGTSLNYVGQVFGRERGTGPAVVGVGDDAAPVTLSWPELRRQVAALTRTLRTEGVRPGDCVVGYTPDVVEAVVAFLAAACVGAIWASCGQEYPANVAAACLGQLDPVALVVADGYRHAGKVHDRRQEAGALRAGLPSLKTVIGVDRLGAAVPDSMPWAAATAGQHELAIEPVPFDQPLWVLCFSGTTGLPRESCTGTAGSCWSTSRTTPCTSTSAPRTPSSGSPHRAGPCGTCGTRACCWERQSCVTTAAPATPAPATSGGLPPSWGSRSWERARPTCAPARPPGSSRPRSTTCPRCACSGRPAPSWRLRHTGGCTTT